MMAYFYLALGFFILYHVWKGVVPASFNLWGKNEAGQRMSREQRLLFGFGGTFATLLGLYGIYRQIFR